MSPLAHGPAMAVAMAAAGAPAAVVAGETTAAARWVAARGAGEGGVGRRPTEHPIPHSHPKTHHLP